MKQLTKTRKIYQPYRNPITLILRSILAGGAWACNLQILNMRAAFNRGETIIVQFLILVFLVLFHNYDTSMLFISITVLINLIK